MKSLYAGAGRTPLTLLAEMDAMILATTTPVHRESSPKQPQGPSKAKVKKRKMAKKSRKRNR